MLNLGEVKRYMEVLYTTLITFPCTYDYFKFKSNNGNNSNDNLEQLDQKLHISYIFLLQISLAQLLVLSNHL